MEKTRAILWLNAEPSRRRGLFTLPTFGAIGEENVENALPLRDSKRHRKTSTRMTNYPFEAVARLQERVWILDVKKPAHNHVAISAMGHPIHRKEAVTAAVSSYI